MQIHVIQICTRVLTTREKRHLSSSYYILVIVIELFILNLKHFLLQFNIFTIILLMKHLF